MPSERRARNQLKRGHFNPGGTTDKSVSRRQLRLKADQRRAEALDEVRDQQRRLDARIRAEQAQAAEFDRQQLGEAATWTARQSTLDRLKENIEKRALWPLGEARNLVRQGYTVEGTVARTGWPADMLADVIPGEW